MEEPTQRWLAQQSSSKWRLACYVHVGLCTELTVSPTEAVGTQLLRDLRQKRKKELGAQCFEHSSSLQDGAASSLSFDPPFLLPPRPASHFPLGVSAPPCWLPPSVRELFSLPLTLWTGGNDLSSGKSEVVFPDGIKPPLWSLQEQSRVSTRLRVLPWLPVALKCILNSQRLTWPCLH